MNTHTNKASENKNQSVVRNDSSKKGSMESSFQFTDNRTEAINHRKLNQIANNSLESSQAAQLKAIANNFSGNAIQMAAVEEEELLQGKFETVQMVAEEEELLQGKFNTIQKQGLEEEELLQGKFETIQKKKNNTGLPDELKSGIENLSSQSLDDVKVHYNSDHPARLNAHAYAQGTDIHVASGQEKHLPHEAWHVVQQKQGRVKPTMQMKGHINVNDDEGLEREADLMGAKAEQIRNSELSDKNNLVINHSNRHSGEPVIQPFLSSLTAMLPAMPETLKEKIDPRRWTINPYFQQHLQNETVYEAGHGRYHSRERHGAEHTLDNIHRRTLPGVYAGAVANPSAMTNTVNPGQPIPMHNVSSRFATPAWQTYSRNIAIQHATAHLPAGVVFPGGIPPGGIPGGNYHRFSINYQGSPAGLSVHPAGPQTAQAVNFVLVGIQYNPATNQAWIIQHFPQAAAVAAPGLIPNHVVPYNQIPWF